jgi:tail assembly chaperone
MPEKKIGSRTYKVEKLPATESTRTLLRLTKIIGPALPKLSEAIADDRDTGTALAAVADLLMNSDADKLTDFLVEIAEHAEVQTERGGSYDPVIYDLIPDLMEGFQLVAFVLQVQYRDFFGGKLGNALSAKKPVEA